MLILWYAIIGVLIAMAGGALLYRWWYSTVVSSNNITYIDGAVYVPVVDADGNTHVMRYYRDQYSDTIDNDSI